MMMHFDLYSDQADLADATVWAPLCHRRRARGGSAWEDPGQLVSIFFFATHRGLRQDPRFFFAFISLSGAHMEAEAEAERQSEAKVLKWEQRKLRELLTLAWPITVSTLSYSIMTLVDTLLVGHLGPAELAGVGMGGTAAFAIVCFSFGLIRGNKTLVSQAVGAGRGDLVRGVPLGGAAGGARPRRGDAGGRAARRAAHAAPVGHARGGRGDAALLLDPQPGGADLARRRGAARDALRRGRRALADGGDDRRQRGQRRPGDAVRVRPRLGRRGRGVGDGDRAGRRVGRPVVDGARVRLARARRDAAAPGGAVAHRRADSGAVHARGRLVRAPGRAHLVAVGDADGRAPDRAAGVPVLVPAGVRGVGGGVGAGGSGGGRAPAGAGAAGGHLCLRVAGAYTLVCSLAVRLRAGRLIAAGFTSDPALAATRCACSTSRPCSRRSTAPTSPRAASCAASATCASRRWSAW